jgi:hypothetical protein
MEMNSQLHILADLFLVKDSLAYDKQKASSWTLWDGLDVAVKRKVSVENQTMTIKLLACHITDWAIMVPIHVKLSKKKFYINYATTGINHFSILVSNQGATLHEN